MDGIIGTGNLVWNGIASQCSGYNGNYTFACQSDAIGNFGQQYFRNFIDNLSYFTYQKAIDGQVIGWSIILVFFMLFLSFIVGFIFFARK